MLYLKEDGRRLLVWRTMVCLKLPGKSLSSQCYSSRPNVHFKPWKGVQSIGDLWRLEGRRALTGSTGVVLRKGMKGLENGDAERVNKPQVRTCRRRQPGLTSATPRSEILSAPSVVSSRFPGLMSLWTIPWLCKYSRPSKSWQKYLEIRADSHRGLHFQERLDVIFCWVTAAVQRLNIGLEESLHWGPN